MDNEKTIKHLIDEELEHVTGGIDSGIDEPDSISEDVETLDYSIRRYKREMAREGTLKEIRKREFYEKPSVKLR